jgi:non-homologous end joining protein Ku
LLELIERKRRAGKDVIASREEERDEEAGGADVVDLMKYLKESLAGGGIEHARSRERRRPRAASRRADKSSEGRKTTPRKRAPRRTATR